MTMTIDEPITKLAELVRGCPPDRASRIDYASALIAAARGLLAPAQPPLPADITSHLATAQLDLRLARGPDEGQV